MKLANYLDKQRRLTRAGKSIGGAVQEPQEMFLGGIVKGISRAVSGVVKGVSKAVSSVGNFVGGIVNNPIVKTAAMFILVLHLL